MRRTRKLTAFVVLAAVVAGAAAFVRAEEFGPDATQSQVAKLGMTCTELPSSIKEVRFVFSCPDGRQLEGRWIAENVGDVAPPNYLVGKVVTTTKGPLNVFSLTRPTNGWPLGLYRLEIREGEHLVHIEKYIIEDLGS